MSRLKVDFEENCIVAEIHNSNASLSKIKEFIKDSFEEYYFGRNAIVIYQDYIASKAVDEKRQKLVGWFVKNSSLEMYNDELASTIMNSYKKQIKIKITSGEVYQDITTIRLSKYTNDSMMIEVKRDTINIVLNFIKSRFIFDLIKQDKEKGVLIIKTDRTNFGGTLKGLLDKKTVTGKKIFFIYDRNYIDTFVHSRQKQEYSSYQHDSIREYMGRIRDSYSVLQLNSQIKDMDTIKRQYYKLAKEFHPDNYFQDGESAIKKYEDKFMQVKEAYETLREHLQKKSA